MDNSNEKTMLTVKEDDGKYTVEIPEKSSVPEVAFDIAVVIRCLLRDGYIKDIQEFLDYIIKYATNPEYNENSEVN